MVCAQVVRHQPSKYKRPRNSSALVSDSAHAMVKLYHAADDCAPGNIVVTSAGATQLSALTIFTDYSGKCTDLMTSMLQFVNATPIVDVAPAILNIEWPCAEQRAEAFTILQDMLKSNAVPGIASASPQYLSLYSTSFILYVLLCFCAWLS
jgi:hypothetical protein